MWEVLGEYQGPPSFKVLVRYMMARMSKEIDRKSYMVYVTDSLRLIPQLMYKDRRWIEIVEGVKSGTQEQTSEEVIEHVISRFKE